MVGLKSSCHRGKRAAIADACIKDSIEATIPSWTIQRAPTHDASWASKTDLGGHPIELA